MARAVYYLELGEGRRVAISPWLIISLIIVLALTVVGLVLAAVSLSEAKKQKSEPVVTPTPAPSAKTYSGFVEDRQLSWNHNLTDHDSSMYREVSANISNTLMDALQSKYDQSKFDVNVTVMNLTEGRLLSSEDTVALVDVGDSYVVALFTTILTPLVSDAEPPTPDGVQGAIKSYAKKHHINIHPHINGITTAAPGTTSIATSTITTTTVMTTTTTAQPTTTTAQPTTTTTQPTTTTFSATQPATTTASSSPPTHSASQSTTTPVAASTTSSGLPPDFYAASEYLKAAMNLSAPPCDDFFNYVCGNWIAAHPIEKGEADIMVFTEVQESAYNVTERALRKVESAGTAASVHQTKAAFDQCSDISNRHQSLPTVAAFSDGIELDSDMPLFHKNWDPRKYDLARLLGKLISCHGASGILQPMVDADVGGDIKTNILFINQGALIRGSPTYYLNETFSHQTEKELNQTLRNITLVLAKQKNIPEENFSEPLEEFVNTVYNVELELAKITLTPDELRNHTEQYNRFNVADLNTEFPLENFDWSTFVRFLRLSQDLPAICGDQDLSDNGEEVWPFDLHNDAFSIDTVIVGQESYIRGLQTVFKNFHKKDIFNYLFVRMFMDYAFDIPESNLFSSDRGCVGKMISLLPWTTGRLYVDESGFSEKDRNKTREMVGELQDALRITMNTIDFFDDPTRQSAVQKVNNIVKNPGFPDWIMNDTALDKFYEHLNLGLGNPWIRVYHKLLQFNFASQMRMLNEPADRKNFIMSPAVVNAWYDPEYNSITFPVAILQAPFFRPNGPMSLNFGGIGAVIGHELTHGFDDEGVQYNYDGELKPWVDKNAERGFREMADCIVNEYNSFCPPELNGTLCLNGKENQGENIADNGGIRQSFNAYRSWLERHTEPAIPGFESFSHEQMFFIGYSSFWCGTETKQFEELQILTNPHSPSRYRVLGTLSNLNEFADAFQCNHKDRYDPEEKCYVWANKPEPSTTAMPTTTERPTTTTETASTTAGIATSTAETSTTATETPEPTSTTEAVATTTAVATSTAETSVTATETSQASTTEKMATTTGIATTTAEAATTAAQTGQLTSTTEAVATTTGAATATAEAATTATQTPQLTSATEAVATTTGTATATAEAATTATQTPQLTSTTEAVATTTGTATATAEAATTATQTPQLTSTTEAVATTGAATATAEASTTETETPTTTAKAPESTSSMPLPAAYYEISKLFSESMHNSTSGCSSFYNYTCGSYNRPLSVRESSVVDAFNTTAYDLVQGIPSINVLKPLASAIANCQTGPANTSSFLLDLIGRLGGLPAFEDMPTKKSLEAVLSAVASVGVDVLVSLEPALDVQSNSLLTISVQQPKELTLGPPEFYDTHPEAVEELTNSLGHFIKHLASKYGLNVSDPAVQQRLSNVANDYVEVEKELISTSTRRVHILPLAKYNSVPFTWLQNHVPMIDWETLRNGSIPAKYNKDVGANSVIPDVLYLEKLNSLVNKTDIDALRNYVVLRAVVDFWHSEKARGTAGVDQRLAYCFQLANRHIPLLTGRAAVDHLSDSTIDGRAFANITHNVVLAMNSTISDYVYFDNAAKSEARSKIRNLRFVNGYPDVVQNDTEMEKIFANFTVNSSRPWLYNLLDIRMFGWENKYESFGKLSSISEIPLNLFHDDAVYVATSNVVFVPLLLLTPPFAYKDGPMYYNFGSLGTRVSAAAFKAVASEAGFAFNSNNIYDQWASKDSRMQFNATQRCIVREYSAYKLPSGNTVNGKFEMDDNVARTAAIKASAAAYNSWAKDNLEEPLVPGYPEISRKKAFFISSAVSRCEGAVNESTADLLNAVVPVAPASVSVDTTAENCEALADSFECSASGSCYVFHNPPVNGNASAIDSVRHIRMYEDAENSRCRSPFAAACGNFESSISNSVYGEMFQRNVAQFAKDISNVVTTSSALSKTRDFFTSCVNENNTASVMRKIRDVINANGGWPMVDGSSASETLQDILNLTGVMERKYGLPTFFRMSAKPILSNPDKFVVDVSQGTLGMGARAMYLNSQNFGAWEQNYIAAINSTVSLYSGGGYNYSDVLSVYEFEVNISKVFASELSLQNYTARQNNRRFVASNLVPYLLAVLDSSQLVTVNEEIHDLVPFLDVLNNTKAARNYIMWRYVWAHAPLLEQGLQERRSTCARFVNEVLPEVTAAIVGAAENEQETVKEMAENIRQSFIRMINKSSWMADGSKQRAVLKLKKTNVVIGSPLLNLTALDKMYIDWNTTASFLDAAYQLSEIKNSRILSSVLNGEDPHVSFNILQPSVTYDYQLNTVIIPKGAISDPLYNSSWPSSINYGGLGFKIGRGFASALSPVGMQFTDAGVLSANGWLWGDDIHGKEFLDETLEDIKQNYSGFVLKDGTQLNGTNFEDSAFADYIGLELAYNAFQETSSERVKGVEHLTSSQLFFAAFGSSLCSHESFPELDLEAAGVLAPARARVHLNAKLSHAYQLDYACV